MSYNAYEQTSPDCEQALTAATGTTHHSLNFCPNMYRRTNFGPFDFRCKSRITPASIAFIFSAVGLCTTISKRKVHSHRYTKTGCTGIYGETPWLVAKTSHRVKHFLKSHAKINGIQFNSPRTQSLLLASVIVLTGDDFQIQLGKE